MIPAVSSTSAASTSTAASRQTSEDAVRSLEADTSGAPSLVERESSVVTISQEAALQAANPAKTSAPAASSSQQSNAVNASAGATSAAGAQTTPDALDAPEAAVQAQQAPTKPDWVYLPMDANKDGKVTVFEQQAYDFRHYPSSLEKAEAYNKAFNETKPKVNA